MNQIQSLLNEGAWGQLTVFSLRDTQAKLNRIKVESESNYATQALDEYTFESTGTDLATQMNENI